MNTTACIELKDLKLQTQIGTYKQGAVIPKHHLLDLTLWISPSFVLISQDSMDKVFDYDPLIAQINQIAGACHYETQETLMTKIVHACKGYPEIESLEICLKKTPVNIGTGSLGVRLLVDKTTPSKISGA
jgi:dihydroneopterin aldolase